MKEQREIRINDAQYAPRIREAQDSASESRTIFGYAIVFNRESELLNDGWEKFREIIEPAAITQELLDAADIKMTLWHNRERLLARRKEGTGTLEVGIDEIGVWYRFDVPHTPDGDTALELVRRGDLLGSSFMYTADEEAGVRYERTEDDVLVRRVLRITGIYDMTIASDPAYPDTSVSTREAIERIRQPKPKVDDMKDVELLRSKAREIFKH